MRGDFQDKNLLKTVSYFEKPSAAHRIGTVLYIGKLPGTEKTERVITPLKMPI